MVIGYHLVWTAYGWWLPNDPRGSMSHYVEQDVFSDLGELHYGRKHVQPASHEIRTFYERVKDRLKFPLLTFSPAEITIIGHAFGNVIDSERYTCYGCALMRDHVHLCIRKHRDSAEEMIEKLQVASRRAALNQGQRDADHPVWGGPGWKVFLDEPDDVRRTVKYIHDNPLKAGKAPQFWGFVHPYDGWPFHKRGK